MPSAASPSPSKSGGRDADRRQVLDGGDSRMAPAAGLDLHLLGVGPMALGAGVEGLDVHPAAQVRLAGVLVGPLHLGAEQGGAGGEVVDVEEPEGFAHRVVGLVADQRVDAGRGLPALVAGEAQVGVRVSGVRREPAREPDRPYLVPGEGRQVGVAGGAQHAVPCGLRDVHALTQVLREAARGVAPGTGPGHDPAVLLAIPVAEGLLGAGEVAEVDAVDRLDGHRRRQHRIQVFGGVDQQLDDVLAAVGVRSRVLEARPGSCTPP